MLSIHRAERSDRLVDALAELLAPSGGDPFVAEVVAVPTRGVERWLSQRLSGSLGASPGRGDGVCANIVFPFPGVLAAGAVAAACGIDADEDPWALRRSVWPLAGVVDRHLDEAWLAPLAEHLASLARPGTPTPGDGGPPEPPAAADLADPRRYRRFAVVRHLADLFDHYAVHRPAMLAAWGQGADVDGMGAPLGEDLAWQAPLWRRLRQVIGTPSPAERLGPACRTLRSHPELVDLPPRLSLFGLTRLPASYLEVVSALAFRRDVHLWLLHPSAVLWDRLKPDSGTRVGTNRPPPRSDGTSESPRNPLLASWGRDAREMQLVLEAAGPGSDLALSGIVAPTTLLGRIQSDIRADRPPPPAGGDDRLMVAADDHSLVVHACHGLGRQVEVLRDAILHLLSDDPTLEARDIIVLCPDIDTFAPIISATFGLGPSGDGHHGGDGREAATGTQRTDLRVRLADRSLRQTNPVLQTISHLLGMVDSRVEASSVLDLAGMAPVRKRFQLDDDDLSTIGEWVRLAGIRWGIDGPHRAEYHLSGVAANTWQWGLERIVAGVVMAADDGPPVDDTLPLDVAATPDLGLVGRFAELVDRLATVLDRLSEAQSLPRWVAAIAGSADAMTEVSDSEGWQRRQLDRVLEEVLDEVRPGASETHSGQADSLLLSPTEITELFADRLKGRPTRANFRTGHLTMCTLVPMRSVPHRVVCLLGLDDTVFPRADRADGDDLLARHPLVGDSDARSSDQQLLLDAVLAAEEHLVITYTGRDERTNELRRPAIPLAELLDVVERTARVADGKEGALDQVVVHHPLQPFDARNFTVGALTPNQPWSFDVAHLAGARAAARTRRGSAPFLATPLASTGQDLITLVDLIGFVRHPVRAFLRDRLGVTLPRADEEANDGLPVYLDPLEGWAVGDRLLRRRLRGWDAEDAQAAELAGGTLPPGWLGQHHLDPVAHAVSGLIAELEGAEPADAVDVTVELGHARTLTGTLDGLRGVVATTVTYSRLKPTHRLQAWVRLLALSAAHPERPWSARIVSRPPGRPGSAKVTVLRPIGDDPGQRSRLALGELATVVDLWERGMCEPLPLAAAASAGWAAGADRDRAEESARRAWEGDYSRPGERSEAEHRLVHGGEIDLAGLLRHRPAAGESGPGWRQGESSRFGRLAHRLWDGLLAHEMGS